MLSSELVRQIRQDVLSRNPAAALQALERMGWADSDAHTIPCPGLRSLDRLVLGSYPTRATVAREQPERSAIDRTAYFAGHRWCLTVQRGTLNWHDFSAAETWSAPASELTAEALQGFTPSFFARQGRFEPVGVARSFAAKIPKEDATEFLLGRIKAWWDRWLSDVATPEHVDRERERFVHLLSALLLLKTIEDQGRVEWLKPGALHLAARNASLPNLLRRAARTLNSRVLRAVADVADGAEHVVPLVRALEESTIDFSSLEIDPVGAFYEQVLGTTQTVGESAQITLPGMGRGQTIVEDASARRRLGAFFTPRSYADVLAHHLVLPEARIATDPSELPSIADLAAGSGELLCSALREIFSESTWRHPDIARTVLADKIWAVDLNPKAVHLAALNVLRTTIRLVPEILDDGRPFPSLDRNFIAADATSQRVLDAIPTVDIALLNPPFKGRTQWSAPERNKARVLDDLHGPVNLALAFLTIGLSKVREGGAVGAILASQLFSGIQHRRVREHIAQQLRIETIVVNNGSPFPDALSYAGLLLGHRLPGVQLPLAEVITVPGGVRNGAADVGAMLYSAGNRPEGGVESHATTKLVSIGEPMLWDWTGTSSGESRSPRGRSPRIPLSSVLRGGIHQGVVAAPNPWKYELFLFDDVPGGGVKHRYGRKVLDDRTSALRAFARPRLLQSRVPNLCEPRVPGTRVFLPGDGSPAGTQINDLRELDPVAWQLAECIRESVLGTRRAELTALAARFAEELRAGHLRFNRSKAFVDESSPQVIISQANRSGVGRARGVEWSAWVNTDGAVVPLEGVHMRAVSVEYAIVIAVLLNVPEAIDKLVRDAPARNQGTTKPELQSLRDHWQLPDLAAGVYHGVLGDLVDAFHAYRRVAQRQAPNDAVATPEYQEVLRLGKALWLL
ncbi:MAG: N-6 DNA methylase [Polyangiaceae bacterium]